MLPRRRTVIVLCSVLVPRPISNLGKIQMWRDAVAYKFLTFPYRFLVASVGRRLSHYPPPRSTHTVGSSFFTEDLRGGFAIVDVDLPCGGYHQEQPTSFPA